MQFSEKTMNYFSIITLIMNLRQLAKQVVIFRTLLLVKTEMHTTRTLFKDSAFTDQ